jgi:lysophospholipase L1-like esterase
MDHDGMVSRQLLATLAILAVGLVPDRLAGDGPARVRASLRSNLFNRSDASRIERGYYEQILEAGRRLDDLADLPSVRGRGHRPGGAWSAPVDAAPLVVRVDDLREVALKCDDAVEKWGVEWRTNAQGMRDRSYSREKPPGTFRIALVGDSIATGWGVNVEKRFESILEAAWNARATSQGGKAVEILNCAVPGHAPGQRWYHFGQIGWRMQPDLVVCESTEADIGWDERRLRYLLARGLAWDSPLYREALAAAGVEPLWNPERYKRALQPHHWELLAGVFRTMVAECHARGVPIVWVLVPRVGRTTDPAGHRALLQLARSVGFNQVIDVTDAFDGLDPVRLAVEADDFHPNALGHAHLARRLDDALGALPELAHLWYPNAGPSGPVPPRDTVLRASHQHVKPPGPSTFPGAEPQ